MPIYSIKFTQHHEKVITARSALDAVCEIARGARSEDGYAVECLELLQGEEGKPELAKEVGEIQEFEVRPGPEGNGPVLHRIEAPPPALPAHFYGKRAQDLFPGLFGGRG